jgi:hypothetical protein
MTPQVSTIQTALWLSSLCAIGVITPTFFALSFTTLGGPPFLIVAWIGSIMLALAQFWLLQKWQVRGWLVATLLFALLGIVMAAVAACLLIVGVPRWLRIHVGGFVVGAIFGGTLGVGQARILARHVRGSRCWIGLQATLYGAAFGTLLSELHPWGFCALALGPLGGLGLRQLFRGIWNGTEQE